VKSAVFLGMALLAACASQTERASDVEGAPVDSELRPNARETPVEIDTVDLPNLGPAPELHNEIWLNTSEPLRLADLRGNVVLIDMWTFG
jgi:hypothetical protein